MMFAAVSWSRRLASYRGILGGSPCVRSISANALTAKVFEASSGIKTLLIPLRSGEDIRDRLKEDSSSTPSRYFWAYAQLPENQYVFIKSKHTSFGGFEQIQA